MQGYCDGPVVSWEGGVCSGGNSVVGAEIGIRGGVLEACCVWDRETVTVGVAETGVGAAALSVVER